MHIHKYLTALIYVAVIVTVGVAVRFPSRKTWWTKQVTYDVHVAGRLTETQMKLAKESGFKSFIALFNHGMRSSVGPGETDPLPSTEQAEKLSEDTLKVQFISLNNMGNDSITSLDIVREFSAVFKNLPKPVLFYSENGYSAAFVSLVHYLNASKEDPSLKPYIDVKEFFKRGGALGYSFGNNPGLVSLLEDVVGDKVKVIGTEAPVSLLDWYTRPASWTIKPLFMNIYVSGQIQTNHLDFIKSTYDMVVCSRRGVKVGDTPFQEEVVLLNIKDKTGTYNKAGTPVRQTKQALEKNRINPQLPNSYISVNSTVNYQSRNPLQFGDDIGYNETLERLAIEENGIEYMHLPVGGQYTYTTGLWDAYRDRLLALGRKKNILLQCRTGYRSSVVGLLLYGCLYQQNSTQALERAWLYGYEFGDTDTKTSIVDLVKKVLDNPAEECQCRDATVCGETTVPTVPIPTTTEASSSMFFSMPWVIVISLLLLHLLSF